MCSVSSVGQLIRRTIQYLMLVKHLVIRIILLCTGGSNPVFDEIVLSTSLMNQVISLDETAGEESLYYRPSSQYLDVAPYTPPFPCYCRAIIIHSLSHSVWSTTPIIICCMTTPLFHIRYTGVSVWVCAGATGWDVG